MKLIPLTTLEQVEWLRQQRNDPGQYKYFRQDMPITADDQAKWWKSLNRNRIKQFIVEHDGQRAGCVQFYPYNPVAKTAEFGIFIIQKFQRTGLAAMSMEALLNFGFKECNLSSIYSDCLDYPGEHRFDFYKKAGFEAFPSEHQINRYKKQGVWVPSIKFFMTKDMWLERNGKKALSTIEH